MKWQELLNKYQHISHLDLERLGAFVLKTSRAFFLAHLRDETTENERKQFESLVARLDAGEPIQYILGEAWFYNRRFWVTSDVLIPRFDTEVLVTAALDGLASSHGQKVLDLCTGSGAIAITLKKERPDLTVYASDISLAALKVAQENAKRLEAEIEWLQGDFLNDIAERDFDMIVCNPPYIALKDWHDLAPEVKREPKNALVADDNGLFFYQTLAQQGEAFLTEGGILAMEIGFNQKREVAELFTRSQWHNLKVLQDEQALDRVVIVEKA